MKNFFARAICISAALMSGMASAQPFEFKGFQLGGTKEAFLQMHAWSCYPVKPQHGPHDEVCLPASLRDKTYLGHPDVKMRAYVFDGHVVEIQIDPWSVYFDEIVEALSGRYGKPEVLSLETKRRQVRWGAKGGDTISYVETLIAPNGWLRFTSTYGAEELARRRAESDAKRKQDF